MFFIPPYARSLCLMFSPSVTQIHLIQVAHVARIGGKYGVKIILFCIKIHQNRKPKGY